MLHGDIIILHVNISILHADTFNRKITCTQDAEIYHNTNVNDIIPARYNTIILNIILYYLCQNVDMHFNLCRIATHLCRSTWKLCKFSRYLCKYARWLRCLLHASYKHSQIQRSFFFLYLIVPNNFYSISWKKNRL